MKLVQLLAKELKEWPEGAKYACQDTAGTYEGSVFFVSNEPEHSDGSGGWSVCGVIGAIHNLEVSSDAKINTVTKSQWQAEREKMNKPKWIRHRGGWMPVGAATIVEVRLRCGDIQKHEACEFLWRHKDCDSAANIMAYRVIEETKDQEIEEVKVADVNLEMMRGDSWLTIGSVSSDFGASVFDGGQPAKGEEVKKTNFGTITYKLEIDATEAAKEIDSLVAKWGQIESPLKWRDEIIELEAYEEEFRREREKLIRKLESEGFKLIDHMAPVYGEQIIDFSDWRNWQVGDRVCATKNFDDVDIGDELIITRLDHADEEQPIGMSAGSIGTSWPKMNWVKFVCRP